LRLLEQWSEAIEAYEAAIDARPGYPEAWNHRGLALHELGEADDALASFDEAIRLRPNFADAHNNRSISLRWLNRAEEAIAAADMARACDPHDTRAFTARGHALRSVGRFAEALENYDQAVAAFPNNGTLRFNRAACLLQLGDYERGWAEYEWRWQRPRIERHWVIMQQPLWLGEQPITGKKILLHAEQGLGDTIQFCRYAKLVADLGASVLLGAPPLLHGLMATLESASGVVSQLDIIPSFDLQCPLLSLPLVFRTRLETIPAKVPYLTAPAPHRPKWSNRLGSRRGLRVGVAWAGNPHHGNDHNRSMTLETAMGMMPEGTNIYCLQRDMRPRDIPALAMFPQVEYFGSDLCDFSDTAALIAEMDLVISVDTSVLHLAGAMGARVWGLLPFACDWRWLVERSDSPWYPTMRLFRQSAPGEWADVVVRVREELKAFMQIAGSTPM
jgi:hypothetical protein